MRVDSKGFDLFLMGHVLLSLVKMRPCKGRVLMINRIYLKNIIQACEFFLDKDFIYGSSININQKQIRRDKLLMIIEFHKSNSFFIGLVEL